MKKEKVTQYADSPMNISGMFYSSPIYACTHSSSVNEVIYNFFNEVDSFDHMMSENVPYTENVTEIIFPDVL